MARVEINVLRGNVQVQAQKNKTRVMLKAGNVNSFPITKDEPIICRVQKDARATVKSANNIVLLLEYEEDDIVHNIKLKSPLKQAMREGKWVIMAPSVG